MLELYLTASVAGIALIPLFVYQIYTFTIFYRRFIVHGKNADNSKMVNIFPFLLVRFTDDRLRLPCAKFSLRKKYLRSHFSRSLLKSQISLIISLKIRDQETPFSDCFRQLSLAEKNFFLKSLWMSASGGSYLLSALLISYYIL